LELASVVICGQRCEALTALMEMNISTASSETDHHRAYSIYILTDNTPAG
jgi:hypothetical protein